VSSAFIITLEFSGISFNVLFIAALFKKETSWAKSMQIISPSTYSSFKAISSFKIPF
jgi:hypothetical protein